MSNVAFIKVIINSFDIIIKSTFSVFEACKYSGFLVPRFCYHELLSVAGNCRMCLVEVVNSIKPIASCVTPVISNMHILLDTPLVLKARENILEVLLLNHPLDCPICDQAGECDLQDQSEKFGSVRSRYSFLKRGVERKKFNPLVSTIMTRCIHCTRCIRFSSEILGSEVLGLLSRGQTTEVGNYTSKHLVSELAGNIVDLCPVGALTSKPYSFKSRPWELRILESLDLTDSFGSHVYINFKDFSIFRIIPKPNQQLNGPFLTDVARYFFDCLLTQRLFSIYTKEIVNNKASFRACRSSNLEDYGVFTKNSLFIIDDTLDLEVINILKLLNYKNEFQFNVRCLNLAYFETNVFYSKFKKTLIQFSESNIIFLLSSNLKAESAILNSKIRIKFIKEDIQVYKFGSQLFSNFVSPCINLSIGFLFNFLEGKDKQLSSLLVSIGISLFIIGQALIKRGVQFNVLETLIKKICPRSHVLQIVLGCNSIGLSFSQIKGLSTQDLVKATHINVLNLKENIFLFKALKNYKKLAWWNTHGPSNFIKLSTMLIPLLPSFHDKGLYVNLEQRGQACSQLFNNFSSSTARYAFSLKKELLKLLVNDYVKFSFFKFYYCMAQKPDLFGSRCHFDFQVISVNSSSKISCLPFKLEFEDSFLFSKMAKHSLVLAECSVQLRQITTNFLCAEKSTLFK